jgi:hypothetical protein
MKPRLQKRTGTVSTIIPFILTALLVAGCDGKTNRIVDDSEGTTGAEQAFQRMEVCRTCHERQYQESLHSVKSGYRSISPLFNGLELAGNFVAQAALESGAIRNNLRPVYQSDSPDGSRRTNMITSEGGYMNPNELRAGFCFGCHNGNAILRGEDSDGDGVPDDGDREVPEWDAFFDPATCPPEDLFDTQHSGQLWKRRHCNTLHYK